VLLTIFSAAVTWGSRADAEDAESVQKVVELNKKALAAYANLDVEEAINLLKQALETCRTAQLDDHLVAARTHVHMGVVLVAGLKQRDQGMEEFKKALQVDPTIKVTKGMLNPEVQSAFQRLPWMSRKVARARGQLPPRLRPSPRARSQPSPRSLPSLLSLRPRLAVPLSTLRWTASAVGQPHRHPGGGSGVPGRRESGAGLPADGASDFVTREMDAVEGSDA